jgi:hypothetical protein
VTTRFFRRSEMPASSEFKADDGEADDTSASEIGDSKIEERLRLRSTTTSVLALDNYG